MAIIAISGKIGSGKDTIAKMLQNLYPKQNWEVHKYGDKLKDVICILTGCTRLQLEDQAFKASKMSPEWTLYGFSLGTKQMWYSDEEIAKEEAKNYRCEPIYPKLFTYREFIQLVGTGALKRIVHPKIWINALFSEYPADGQTNWIISDLRFQDEFKDIIKRGNSVTIRVDRPENPYFRTEFNNHSSETDLDNQIFDIFVNNTDLQSLEKRIREIDISKWLTL